MKKVSSWTKVILIILVTYMYLMNIGVIKNDYNIKEIISDKIYKNRLEKVEKIDISTNGKLGNSLSNINNYGHAVASKDDVYYLKDSIWLCRSDQAFSFEETIIRRESGSGIWHLNTVGDYLFYMQGDAIVRKNIDENKTSTIPLKKYMIDLQIIDNWIYFIRVSNSDEGIFKMTINGENLQQLSQGPSLDIAIYEDRIYYSYTFDGMSHLNSMDLDGGDKISIANIPTRDMVVENNSIYYINVEDFKLYRFNMSNETNELLVDDEVSKFCKNDQWIYFSKYTNEHNEHKGLFKIDENGNGLKQINNDLRIEALSAIGEWIMYRSSVDNEYPTLKRVSILNDEIIPMK